KAASQRAMPSGVGVGRLPAARGDGDLAVRRHREAVIKVREGALESTARQHLLIEDLSVGRAAHGMGFVREDPGALAVDHASAFCARSMLSKSARKLPYPNPSSPQRWMIS